MLYTPSMEKLSDLQNELIDGAMLGDGCIYVPKNATNLTNPRFVCQRNINDLEYLKFQENILHNICSDKAIHISKSYDKRHDKYYEWCRLNTRNSELLRYQYERWYKNRIKTIPDDLVLTKFNIAIWFADDGTVYHPGKQENKNLKFSFATHGFKKDEVYKLKCLLDTRYNTKFRMYTIPGRNQYSISGSNCQARLLFADIDEAFPISMSRKSNIWRKSIVDLFNASSDTNHKPKDFSLINRINILYSILNEQKTAKCIALDNNLFYIRNNSVLVVKSQVKEIFKKLIKDKIIEPINFDGFSINMNYEIINKDYLINLINKLEARSDTL